jgi:hypothetical protein
VSFDNIAQSLELVFVIISTNTFTDIMYYTIDAEYMVAALCMPHDLFPLTASLCHIVRPPRVDLIDSIIVLSFWLVNLVIAVITSSFQVTRDEMQQSAFVSKRQQYVYSCILNLTSRKQLKDDASSDQDQDRPVSWGQRLYDQTRIVWVGLIVVDLIVQCFRTSTMSNTTKDVLGMSWVLFMANNRRH